MTETRAEPRQRAAAGARAEARREDANSAPARGGPDSLFRNAYFLMLSTGVSAVLGLGFWLVAARYYSEEAVGQGSAAIAAMRLLASITATTMIGAVVRFVPRAGRATGALVWRAYAASSVVVAVAAFVFLLTLDLWGASYAPLGAPAAGAVFVVACVAWALLTLQDGVLTGLRKALWVPVGNAVFSVGKLILLAVFATVLPVLGIFVSWAAAIALSTLPLGWLIFRRLIPRQQAADRHVEPPRLREMGRFLAGDSLGALFSLAMINLLPVMVAVRFSAAENGYFYVAYTVGGTMEFMAINMASSLTAHASHDPRHLADGVRGALRRMTLLLVPVVLVLVLFAPRILTPFDEDYAEHGTTVLRLLALGALPRVVVELYIGVLRVQGRTGLLAALQGAMCTLVLGSAAVLFGPAGIAGAGWAVLLGMTLIAGVSVVGLRAALRPAGAGDAVGVGGEGSAPGSGAAARSGVGVGAASAPGAALAAAPAPVPAPAHRLGATAGYATASGYGTSWARRAAAADEDTVPLFIGRRGYEREALEADTLAVIVWPQGRSGARGGGASMPGAGASVPGARSGVVPGYYPGTPPGSASELASGSSSESSSRPPAGGLPAERAVEPAYTARGLWSEKGQRWLRGGLWTALAAAVTVFALGVRDLPWLRSSSATGTTGTTGPAGTTDAALESGSLPGRAMLDALPWTALGAGLVLLLLYAGAVTLSLRHDPWLPGTALGAVVLALYAVPVSLGREPGAVGGTFYTETARFLAEAMGLDGPVPLLRWAPPLCQLLCLVALSQVLARLGERLRLPWTARWGLVYLAALGGWVWREALAPFAPPTLAALFVLAVLLSLHRAPPRPTT
ncbi:lipopolysaccharide biosynthesis protein [Streptomyces niveiscabiei]|nr:lipopolysaccharide biosynthesis protein [Streptomyces niveiscabiei]MDX3383673.1 lipopolysaccharide biosynthesis protein [Streptomyces niveiscabiei]